MSSASDVAPGRLRAVGSLNSTNLQTSIAVGLGPGGMYCCMGVGLQSACLHCHYMSSRGRMSSWMHTKSSTTVPPQCSIPRPLAWPTHLVKPHTLQVDTAAAASSVILYQYGLRHFAHLSVKLLVWTWPWQSKINWMIELPLLVMKAETLAAMIAAATSNMHGYEDWEESIILVWNAWPTLHLG